MGIDELKQQIKEYIKTNGNGEITGQVLQDQLLAMIDTLSDPVGGMDYVTINRRFSDAEFRYYGQVSVADYDKLYDAIVNNKALAVVWTQNNAIYAMTMLGKKSTYVENTSIHIECIAVQYTTGNTGGNNGYGFEPLYLTLTRSSESGGIIEHEMDSEGQFMFLNSGDGSKYLADNGQYKEITGLEEVDEIKTAQSDLLSRVNDYMYDMSGLMGKLAVRDGAGADEKIDEVENRGFFHNDGVLEKRSAGFNYQILQVESNKVYYIKMPTLGIATVASLVLFDGDGNVLKTLLANKTIDSYFVFTGVDHIGLSWSDEIANSLKILKSFDIQDLTTVLNTQQGNRALYVAAGAVYNESTGFYELNGLTDITEEQMKVIYNSYIINLPNDATAFFSSFKGRTNIPFNINSGGWVSSMVTKYMCASASVEVFNVGTNISGSYCLTINANSMFYNCLNLREIIGYLNLINISSVDNVANIFKNCVELRKANIKNLKVNISFADSAFISLESLQYLITNADNTSPITVTVHTDVYNKIQDESQTDWHALIEAATAKQITFATA